MTLDEAIKHAIYESQNKENCNCANEHFQLAGWLTELKLLKDADKVKDGRIAELEAKQEAIKEFCREQIIELEDMGWYEADDKKQAIEAMYKVLNKMEQEQ